MGLLVVFKLLFSHESFGARDHLDAGMWLFRMNSSDVILESIVRKKGFSAMFTLGKLRFLSF